MNTLKSNNVRIEKLHFLDKIHVYLTSGDVLTIPYAYTDKLSKAKVNTLEAYRLIADGIGIHFEMIDEDISLNGIIEYKISHELQAS